MDEFIEHLKQKKKTSASSESLLKECAWWKEAGVDHVIIPLRDLPLLERKLKEEKLYAKEIDDTKNNINFAKTAVEEGVTFLVTSDRYKWAGIVAESADVIFLVNGSVLRPKRPYNPEGFATAAMSVDRITNGFISLKNLNKLIPSRGEEGEGGYDHMLVILDCFKEMGMKRYICLKSEMKLLEEALEEHKDKDLTNYLISREYIKGFMDKNIIYLVTEKEDISSKFKDWKAVREDGSLSDVKVVKK